MNALSRILWKLKGVRVNQFTKIVGKAEIGRGTRLCDFVFLLGPVKIGRNCDIQPGTVVWGGGSLEVGDFVSIGPNCTILTGEYLYQELGLKCGGGGITYPAQMPLRMVDRAGREIHKAVYGTTRILPDAYLGAGVTVRQGVTIGQGAVVGAGSFVNRDTENWGIYVGTPAKKIGERPVL